jgi:hypothetical protein
MADKRSEYVVEIGGQPHVFLLTEEDAAKYDGAKKSDGAAKKLAEESSKAMAAANKALSGALNK